MWKKGFWLGMVAWVAVGCLDEPDCYLLNNHLVGIAFRKIEPNEADTLAVTGFGTLTPPLRFSNDTTLTRLILPLNYFQDETTFFFDESETVRRVLRLSYVSQAQFVSDKCGEKFVLSGLRIEEHNFDSVRLVRDFPTRDGSSIQIEIFR